MPTGPTSTGYDTKLECGLVTNHLCLHYLVFHRSAVPKSELKKLEHCLGGTSRAPPSSLTTEERLELLKMAHAPVAEETKVTEYPGFYVKLQYTNRPRKSPSAARNGVIWVKFRDEKHYDQVQANNYADLLEGMLPLDWEIFDPHSQLEPLTLSHQQPEGVDESDMVILTS
jgi:hypothetical protein